MILSVSRRTDIPAFYFDWFLQRLQEGYLLVEHPRNPSHLSRVALSPQVVDCIVFWSKNPAPILPHLAELERMGYPFYVQFTLTPYDAAIEPAFGQKKRLVETFQALARAIGPQRVVWRYDPILLDPAHPVKWHLEQFRTLCLMLQGFTRECVISFVDSYPHLRGKFLPPSQQEILWLAERFSRISQDSRIELSTCAEAADLSRFGIRQGACIDQQLVEELLGCSIRAKKDPGQRPACGCMESVDVGAYNTCPGGCAYCYAVKSPSTAYQRSHAYDPASPVLCRTLSGEEEIKDRSMDTVKLHQLSLFSGFEAKGSAPG